MNLVNQIVELIMSFIINFLDKLKLQELSEALGAKKKKTATAKSETDKLYEEYKNDYEAYKADMANRALPDFDNPAHNDGFGYGKPNLRPSPGKVQQGGSEAAGDDKGPSRGERSPIPINRRPTRHNRKTKRRK